MTWPGTYKHASSWSLLSPWDPLREHQYSSRMLIVFVVFIQAMPTNGAIVFSRLLRMDELLS